MNNKSTFDLHISDDYKESLSNADVLIDFTIPEATLSLLEATKDMSIRHVIGTTGFSLSEEAQISRYAEKKVIIKAGNMSLGVNLVTKLTEMVASVTNLKASELIVTFGDAHIYKNHINQVNLQLQRIPRDLPQITLNKKQLITRKVQSSAKNSEKKKEASIAKTYCFVKK